MIKAHLSIFPKHVHFKSICYRKKSIRDGDKMIDLIFYPVLVGIIIYGLVMIRIMINYQNNGIQKKGLKPELDTEKLPPSPTVLTHSTKQTMK